jgi:hypothetical protein
MTTARDVKFYWKGEPVATIGELFDTALKAAKAGEAPAYLAEYRRANEHADANLGYVIGYGDEDSRRLMYEAFELSHPMIGGRP